eukprot:1610463-Prymnesium_polylepis.1
MPFTRIRGAMKSHLCWLKGKLAVPGVPSCASRRCKQNLHPVAWIGTTRTVMLAIARKKWCPAERVVEARGRPPKRSRCASYVTQQQRAFAAAILHSVYIYLCMRTCERTRARSAPCSAREACLLRRQPRAARRETQCAQRKM